MSRCAFALSLLVLAAAPLCGQITINGSGAAFPTIQSAINAAASGDDIDIGAGTYFENLNLLGKHLVIKGAGAGQTLIDGGSAGRCITIVQNTSGTTRIKDLTIRNGRHPGTTIVPIDHSGGGILARDLTSAAWKLRLEDLTIENCVADLGGGVFAAPTIDLVMKNCLIKLNGQDPVVPAPFGSAGGGVSGGTMTIEDCVFEDNSCNGLTGPAGPYGPGGGIYCNTVTPGDLSVARTTLRRNHGHMGGGIAARVYGDVMIENCSFLENSTDQLDSGSAIDVVGFGNGSANSLTTELTIDNCLVTGNQFASGGTLGPSTAIFAVARQVIIQRSTITRNGSTPLLGPAPTAIKALVPVAVAESQFAIRNSIVAGNIDDGVMASGFDVVTTSRSLLSEGALISSGTTVNSSGLLTELDPAFVDPDSGDFQLRPGSPCVDAGNGGAGIPATDLLGQPRVVGTAPDMGCFELQNQDPGPDFAGTVAAGDVLFFNGSAGGPSRGITVDAGSTCTLSVMEPLSGVPAPFIIWGHLGVPGSGDAFPIYFAGGAMAFTPHIVGIGNPLLFTMANNILTPNSGLLSSTPAPWSATGPAIGFPITMTLQGLIDAGTGRLAITNSLTLHTR